MRHAGRSATVKVLRNVKKNTFARNAQEDRMKRLLMTGALAFALAAPAVAADLPQPMPPPPPQEPAAYVPATIPVYNWGGIYVGVNGGYGFGNSKWTNTLNTPTTTGTFDVNGFLVGPTLGANFQTGGFVFGIEADFDASWMSGTTSNAFCGVIAAGLTSCETKNTWLGTARARFGYAADRVLFYGTGGGAYGSIQSGVGGGFQSSNEPGWTAGAGVEAAFTDNWTARIEYLYVDLQSATCNTTQCGFPVGDTIKFSTSMIRFGLDYKFR
jgi:outer membrane immunogenic protein